MGKNKGFDVIADAHERSNHNINPYYWFNRVTPYTIAQWKTGKRFSPVYFLMYSVMGLLVLGNFRESAIQQNKSLFSFLFDFSNSANGASSAAFIIFFALWVILGISTVQVLLEWNKARRYSKTTIEPIKTRKEKKKRHPKRPKNWA